MNKLVESALERVQKTQWFLNKGVLEIRDAVIVFTNFSGQKNQWGNASKYFNVVLPADLVEFFQSQPIHVNLHKYPREAEGTDEDPFFYYINVKSSMDGEYPPIVTLYVNSQYTNSEGGIEIRKSKVTLNDATIGCLDRADLDRVDCKLNMRESKAHPGNAVFYLRQLNAIQTKVPDFGGIYDEWDEEIEANPEIAAANAELIKQ